MRLDGADPAAIERAAGLLAAGGLVAFPTETVYGLGADAHLLLLAAQLVVTATFAPWAIAAALRISAE